MAFLILIFKKIYGDCISRRFFIIFIYEGGAFERLISCYGRAFEHIFFAGDGGFEKSNFKKFKFPGSARGGGMLKFRIDRYITTTATVDPSTI